MYITVASNSESDSRHAGNKPSQFINTLSSEIDVSSDKYEVGVKKLIYTNNFNSIVDEFMEYRHTEKVEHTTYITQSFGDVIEGKYIRYKHEWINGKRYWFPVPQNMYMFATRRITPETVEDYKVEVNIANKIQSGQEIKHDGLDYVLDESKKPFTDKDHFIESYYEEITDAIQIPKGFYNTIEDLMENIKLPQGIVMGVEGDRVYVDMTDVKSKLILKKGMEYVLGFKENTINGGRKHVAEYRYNLNRGLFAIFIYSNIVEYSHVGHQDVPLLDIVSIPPAVLPGDSVSIENTNPVYTPVRGNSLREIQITLCSDSGEIIPFTQGKTLLTLHIRKVNGSTIS